MIIFAENRFYPIGLPVFSNADRSAVFGSPESIFEYKNKIKID